MADSTGIFTFDDPLQTEPKVDQSTPLCPSQQLHEIPLNSGDRTAQEIDDLFDAEALLSDPIIWQVCNGQDDLTGNSQTAGDTEFLNPDSNPVFGDHSVCACCQVLREITHTNGDERILVIKHKLMVEILIN